MKRNLLFLVFVVLAMNMGCSERNESLITKYEELYENDFSFVEIHTRFKEEIGEYRYGYEGEFVADPYEKHLVVTQGESSWTELYTYEDGNELKGKIKEGDTWQEVSVEDDKFTGYHERKSIRIVSMKMEEINGENYDVYDTEYTVKAGKELEGVVKQQYYVSRATGKIEKIISDITEEDVINSINILMQVNEISLEEAEKMVNRVEHTHIIEIDIHH